MTRTWSTKHIVAASVATILSLALHIVVIAKFPDLPVGKPPEMDVVSRIKTTQLGDVKRGPMSVLDRPSRYRPENPEKVYDVKEEYLSYVDALEESLPAEPDFEADIALEAEDSPLAEPEVPVDRSIWQARAEILQIEERLHSDEVSVLPRRYAENIPRSAVAPDISFPVEWNEETAAEALRTTLPPSDGLLPGLSRAGSVALSETKPEMTESESIALEESSALLDEGIEDIVSSEAIENLLALDVSAFRDVADDSVYYRIRLRRNSEMALPVLDKDVLLIQDCSESMTQRKLNNCKEGLHRWLDRINEGDRYNFMRFSDHTELCFQQWTSPTPANDARAAWFIENMKARGKTDVFETLTQLLALEKDEERPLIAVLISDGRPTMGVVDSSDIIERFTQSNRGNLSMFTVGGGRRVNHFLMDLISYRNRGDSLLVEERSDIPDALEQWADELSRPVLAELSCNFTGNSGNEVYPEVLTHLYMDRPLLLYGKCDSVNDPLGVRIVGKSRGKVMDMVFSIDLKKARPGTDDIRTMWAWHKVYHLIGQHIRTQQAGVMEEIRSLAERFGLAVPYGGDIPLP